MTFDGIATPEELVSTFAPLLRLELVCNACGKKQTPSFEWACVNPDLGDQPGANDDGVLLSRIVECGCGAVDDYSIGGRSYAQLMRELLARGDRSERGDSRVFVARSQLFDGTVAKEQCTCRSHGCRRSRRGRCRTSCRRRRWPARSARRRRPARLEGDDVVGRSVLRVGLARALRHLDTARVGGAHLRSGGGGGGEDAGDVGAQVEAGVRAVGGKDAHRERGGGAGQDWARPAHLRRCDFTHRPPARGESSPRRARPGTRWAGC